ncbi:UDP-N-acetylmuramoyl-tripeptide--D-alanyl-D-alanine ligase [Candidatus Curtissbacteria bacterium]|nr:UDP-N-acetylmuramoyl-tripeptide--D-alanyl-D-alanine ligase [Candidatus Curtissbacteria bacterium]
MFNLDVYRQVKAWKKPIHISRTLAAKHYLKLLPNLEIIAITGSVGKTLTQNAIASVLSQKFKTVVGEENLDPTFRIPKTILSAKPWDQKMILEFGVEQVGDMDHYLSIVTPKIAVVTIIAPTHTKYFGGLEGVASEKAKLVKSLPKSGYAVLNADDPEVVKVAPMTHARVWWFGQKAKDGIKISHFAQNLKGSRFRMHYNSQKASVSWKIIGRHQLLSAYAAATVGIICGLTLKQIARGLFQVKPPQHRLNPIKKGEICILDDTYNSSPKAAEEALNTLIDLGKKKKKIAVFGEMKDLGKISKEEHRLLGQKVARSSVNYLMTVGSVAEEINKSTKRNGFKGKTSATKSTNEVIKELKKIPLANTIILVKGSRHAHLERIISGLLGKSTRINCYHCGTLE